MSYIKKIQISGTTYDIRDNEALHDASAFDAEGSASRALNQANEYTDNAVIAVKNDLLNGAGEGYNTLKELGDLIDKKEDAFYKQISEPTDASIGSFWLMSNASKNLFHSEITSISKNGVTVTYDQSTQEITLNGTLTNVGDLPIASNIVLNWKIGDTYTVSVRHIDGTAELADGDGANTYAWSIFNTSASKFLRGSVLLTSFNDLYSYTGTAFESSAYNIFLQCWRVGTVFNNYKVKVQIEIGSVVTDYEPYFLDNNRNAILKFKNSNNEWVLVDSQDAVKYIEQNLTDEQKLQARENIGIDLNNYYTQTQIDTMEFITVEDIDAICGANIVIASEVMF